ncbi:hypothetical protein [Ramlibacter sp. AN1133]|uniref:hypothetical protein n=1 Tax=Ramlibacter sp. AN1133 TaxID=3133429 RepID=UPI0030BB5559
MTTADCARLTSEADSIAALDLANPNIRAVNDFVLAVDPERANKVFVRRPYDFVNWVASNGGILNLLTLRVATHETLHMTDAVLRACAPTGYKALFFGRILDTGLLANETASIKIVEGEIEPARAAVHDLHHQRRRGQRFHRAAGRIRRPTRARRTPPSRHKRWAGPAQRRAPSTLTWAAAWLSWCSWSHPEGSPPARHRHFPFRAR